MLRVPLLGCQANRFGRRISQNQNCKGEQVKSWPPKPALKHIPVLGAYTSLELSNKKNQNYILS